MIAHGKRWVGQPHILHWFWRQTGADMIADRKLRHDDELVNWCWQHNCIMHDRYIVCPDSKTYLLFALKWLSA